MNLYDPLELADLAAAVALEIKEDLDKQWYEASGIELCIRWLPTKDVKANASAEPSLQNIERHVISLSFGLVNAIYANALEFARFAHPGPGGQIEHGIHRLPKRFTMLHAAELMFISGINFVIFHEVAHLNQNHGAIRALYGSSSNSCVSEFGIAGEAEVIGEQAAISHATELAADFEALDWMARMLRWYKGEEYLDHAYLQCAIVSCIMLMFNDGRPVRLDAEASGTHPYPMIRMECWVRLYSERISVLTQPLDIVENKPTIVKMLDDTTLLALMSCLTRFECIDEPEYRDFCTGSSTHPNYKIYMSQIIDIWSRHDEQARNSRKYGGLLSLMYFTNDFRESVGAVPNRNSLSEHLQRTEEVLARSRSQN